MKALIGLVIVSILAFAATLAVRLGVFKDVRVTELEEGPFKQVYLLHSGPYHQIVPKIEKVEDWAEENGEPCEFSFGEFLDDPKEVDEDRLQSHGGCIVNKDWSQGQLPEGMQYREFSRRRYVVATFNGAPSIGPYKVYPKALAYLEEHGRKLAGPVMEIYHVVSDTAVETKYLFPIEANPGTP
jgi:AraC family transcriptional regulator